MFLSMYFQFEMMSFPQFSHVLAVVIKSISVDRSFLSNFFRSFIVKSQKEKYGFQIWFQSRIGFNG